MVGPEKVAGEFFEVIKGASSVLFGSSALNGAINLRTAFPRDTPMTKINFLTGVYDHATVKFDTSEYDLNSPGSIRNKQGVLSSKASFRLRWE